MSNEFYIVLGNGMVSSGNKSLLDPVLTQFYVDIVSLGHNGLSMFIMIKGLQHRSYYINHFTEI